MLTYEMVIFHHKQESLTCRSPKVKHVYRENIWNKLITNYQHISWSLRLMQRLPNHTCKSFWTRDKMCENSMKNSHQAQEFQMTIYTNDYKHGTLNSLFCKMLVIHSYSLCVLLRECEHTSGCLWGWGLINQPWQKRI